MPDDERVTGAMLLNQCADFLEQAATFLAKKFAEAKADQDERVRLFGESIAGSEYLQPSIMPKHADEIVEKMRSAVHNVRLVALEIEDSSALPEFGFRPEQAAAASAPVSATTVNGARSQTKRASGPARGAKRPSNKHRSPPPSRCSRVAPVLS
jgi:hypothetical protein